MKMIKIQTVVLTALIVAGSIFSANAQDASAILKKMDDVMYSPKDMTGKNKIIFLRKWIRYRRCCIKFCAEHNWRNSPKSQYFVSFYAA